MNVSVRPSVWPASWKSHAYVSAAWCSRRGSRWKRLPPALYTQRCACPGWWFQSRYRCAHSSDANVRPARTDLTRFPWKHTRLRRSLDKVIMPCLLLATTFPFLPCLPLYIFYYSFFILVKGTASNCLPLNCISDAANLLIFAVDADYSLSPITKYFPFKYLVVVQNLLYIRPLGILHRIPCRLYIPYHHWYLVASIQYIV